MIKNKVVIGVNITNLAQSKIEALGGIGLITVNALPEESSANSVQLKNPADFSKIIDKNLPYCFVEHQSSKIYFYG